MTTKERWQRYTAGIALIATLACLTLKYMHHIRLGTSWWGLLLFVSWGTTAIALVASVIAANSKTCFINLLLLAPLLFFLGSELDLGVRIALLAVFWIQIAIAFVVELKGLFTKEQVEES